MSDPQYFTEAEQQASEPTEREERLLETIAQLEADRDAWMARADYLMCEGIDEYWLECEIEIDPPIRGEFDLWVDKIDAALSDSGEEGGGGS